MIAQCVTDEDTAFKHCCRGVDVSLYGYCE